MPTAVITPGAAAVTAADVRAQARIDATDEDAYITGFLIPSVEQMFVDATRCRLTTTVLEQVGYAWPCDGLLPLLEGPVQSVASVTYTAVGGAATVLPTAGWRLQAMDDQTARLVLLSTPELEEGGTVAVRYTAGFTATPAPARLWLLAHVAHFFNHREAAASGDLKPLPFVSHLIAKWLRVPI